jgi:hypothetical protein
MCLSSPGERVFLRLDASSAVNRSLGTMPRLWRTSPVPSDYGLPTWVAADDPLLEQLPKGRWSLEARRRANASIVLPFTERIGLVRLMGGWKVRPQTARPMGNRVVPRTRNETPTCARDGSRRTARWARFCRRGLAGSLVVGRNRPRAPLRALNGAP